MRRFLLTAFITCLAFCSSAQKNMEAFCHLSIGAEAGLHGFGVEVAMPIQKHLVLKAGYNWIPSGDLFNTDILIDTKDLRQAQEAYEMKVDGYRFQHRFGDESVINAGLRAGLDNYKVMIDWYPFVSRRFYFAGGVYYTPGGNRDDSFIHLSGNVTENDWKALAELRSTPGNEDSEMALDINGRKYAVVDKDGSGYLQTDLKLDPLKYYVGMGIGRCIPNSFLGLQLEVGTMIYHNAKLYCQDEEVKSIIDAAEGFGNDAKEIIEYVDKYPIYPQVTLRISFRLF